MVSGVVIVSWNDFIRGLSAGQYECLLAAGMVLLAVVSVALFIGFGRDKKLSVRPSGSIPDGLNPAELGYALDGYVDNRDVLALIIHWAVNGYLSINCTGKDRYSLTKILELDDAAKPHEKYFFHMLFRKGDTVEELEFRDVFRPILKRTGKMVLGEMESCGSGIFTRASLALKLVLAILAALPVYLTLILALYRSMGGFVAALIAACVVGTTVLIPIFGIIHLLRSWRGQSHRDRIVGMIKFCGVMILFLIGFMIYAHDASFPLLAPMAILSTVAIGLCAVFITKRTPYGQKLLEQTEGLRLFLHGEDLAGIEAVHHENPHCFDFMLPYAYMFRMTEEWTENISRFKLKRPKWYTVYKQYNIAFTSIELETTMDVFLYNMICVVGARRYNRLGI